MESLEERRGPRRDEPLRIVSMLTKLAQRGHELREEPAAYGDYDNDNDNDNEEETAHNRVPPTSDLGG